MRLTNTSSLQVAINNEVMVAISNLNYAMPGGMLTTWAEGVKRAGVKNAMVVALDDQAKLMAEQQGLTGFQMQLEVNKASCCIGVAVAMSDG